MASIDTQRQIGRFSAGNLAAVISRSFSTLSAWNDARITRKSLSKLSARELDDIGLCAADINRIATFGKH